MEKGRGKEEERVATSAREQVIPTETILDPFCGTGVILQEAVLMGYDVYGTDLERRMVEYSQTNLDWLSQKYAIAQKCDRSLEAGDATSYKWGEPFDFIATEAYLGQPFSVIPDVQKLEEVAQGVNIITKKFLKNLASQTKPGFRLCVAVPAWQTKNGIKHLPLLDSLTDMGYNRVSFSHVSNDDLIYSREGQIVARELLVITRI